MKKFILSALGVVQALTLLGKTPSAPQATQIPGGIPQLFIENKGQIRDQLRQQRRDIRFRLSGGQGANVFIGDTALQFQFIRMIQDKLSQTEKSPRISIYRMDVCLLGANPHAAIISEEPGNYYEQYYNDWSGEDGVKAASFAKLTYRNIYPNIDWILYSKGGTFKQEFRIHPGGKVSDIRFQYHGSTGLSIDAEGNLHASTPYGTITEQAPISWQPDSDTVHSAFVLKDSVLSYQVSDFSGELVIDPVLEWSTYYGDASSEVANSITTDGNNQIYFCGNTSSAANIATTGAYQISLSGIADACLIKFDAGGNRLWGTYYGGSANDYGFGVATDKANNVYTCGGTVSTSGIASAGAHQTSSGGLQDAMIFKFDTSGKRIWSSFLGGADDDQANDLVADPFGFIYVGGSTSSSTAIATPAAFQASYAGGARDAFIVRFDTAGKRIWGSYFGGTDVESGDALSCDSKGFVYLGGPTLSSSGIATSGAHQTMYAGGFTGDGYLVQFDSSGKRLWSTYYGGVNNETVHGLSCDATGNIYLCGQTQSPSGIATSGAFKTVNSGYEAYLVRFDQTGKRLWGTYYGDATSFRQEIGYGVFADARNNVYLTGKTDSSTGLATAGAHQTIAGGKMDAFLTSFDSSGNRLWGTYFGGNSDDIAFCITGDQKGNVYIAGNTSSSSGIASVGAFKTSFGGAYDMLLAKFCFEPIAGPISSPTDTVCKGLNLPITTRVPGGSWISQNGKVSFSGGSLKGLSTGYDTILYVVSNNCGADTSRKVIRVTDCAGSKIQEAISTQSLLLIPNPAKDIVRIYLSEMIRDLQLSDLSGRLLLQLEPGTGELTLDVSRLPSGLYFLRLNGHVLGKLAKD